MLMVSLSHTVIYFIPRNSYSKNATGKKIYYEILKDFKPEILRIKTPNDFNQLVVLRLSKRTSL